VRITIRFEGIFVNRFSSVGLFANSIKLKSDKPMKIIKSMTAKMRKIGFSDKYPAAFFAVYFALYNSNRGCSKIGLETYYQSD